ncbi:exodeoxyribonuclease VII large subunit [bacterium]|nr:MAG: exodeoxyribonuclease VII large subunit [bacterium]
MTMDLFSSSPRQTKDDDEPDSSEIKIYSVVEITRHIKFLIEESFPSLVVRGEASNLTRHSSGHIYFTLKDELAQIKCVIWRSQAQQMTFSLNEGMKFLVRGKLSLYEKGGYYQITVLDIQPEGIGELQLAFEQLKKKLFAEGLFSEKHKKPIPGFPETVGIISSPTGAAIRDIVSVCRRRMPSVQLILSPVKVQGDGAVEEIVRAIKDFDSYNNVDVLIIGRGGGSIEDLWAFNDEKVARAIYHCSIPTISAVGHEIDFTIADFVADVRAATPSAAAEIAVPDKSEVEQQLANLRYTLIQNIENTIGYYRDRLKHYEERYAFRRPENIVEQYRQQADGLERRMSRQVIHHIRLYGQNLKHFEDQLRTLNPRNTLQRGYTITHQHNKVVQSLRELAEKEPAVIEFYDGKSEVEIKKISR